jgi:hypothetical protein
LFFFFFFFLPQKLHETFIILITKHNSKVEMEK